MEKGLKPMVVSSLKSELLNMEIGETRVPPADTNRNYVKRMCSELKNYGFCFITSTKAGYLTVTRLQ